MGNLVVALVTDYENCLLILILGPAITCLSRVIRPASVRFTDVTYISQRDLLFFGFDYWLYFHCFNW
jgi:hypothetical protein